MGAAAGMSKREANALLALARLVQDITKPEVLTISQDDYEIRVAREDDFAMSCSFYEGVAQATDSAYGTEVCSWDGETLISHLVLPDSLLITHRFTMSPDGNYLRVITTASSGTFFLVQRPGGEPAMVSSTPSHTCDSIAVDGWRSR